MHGMLKRLIYRSFALCGPDEGERICARACSRNHGDGITGGLLLTDGVFLQYLEGPELEVEALCTHIMRDARHTSCEVIDRRSIGGRVFGKRPMQWLAVDAYTHSIIQTVAPYDAKLANLNATLASALFQALSEAPLRR
ncbi:BLUF domain-containing protein [Variovorax guangxiensis]|uniref:BLUF domain-containing protein n=1 Tax=Variovorax guangxiensis TaxID=1775474 RepID=A0A502E120_9BURK|nr:BLUF domain-containing protein [Variovorax guangxiensis]TPG26511.1 BLUF domain-containing protein [Variovorax ginsengisoli]TPG30236.1 BLUF domain-containing protein [Variovorax guangxiensis]